MVTAFSIFNRYELQNNTFVNHILNNYIIKLHNNNHLSNAFPIYQQLFNKLSKTSMIIVLINSPNCPYLNSYN